MNVNDEMIARFFNGKVNSEEKMMVRKYLAKNPKELEKALFFMDRDDKFYVERQQVIENKSVGDEDFVLKGITIKDIFVGKKSNAGLDSCDDFIGRLNKMCNEI